MLFRSDPSLKCRVLGASGWDLTPAAFLDYNGLADKYRPIAGQYPVEDTIWNTEEVFDLLVK